MPRTARARSAAGSRVSTGTAEGVLNAASSATTKAPVAAHTAEHLQGNICQVATAPFAAWRDSMRSRRQPRTRLAVSLKLAIEALQNNIRKMERSEAHPLLIAARKRELFKMQDELGKLRRDERKKPRWEDGDL